MPVTTAVAIPWSQVYFAWLVAVLHTLTLFTHAESACINVVCTSPWSRRSMSRGRSLSVADPRPGSGVKDAVMRNKAIKMADKAQWRMNKMAKIGEADRAIPTKMPKHLFR